MDWKKKHRMQANHPYETILGALDGHSKVMHVSVYPRTKLLDDPTNDQPTLHIYRSNAFDHDTLI